MKIHDNHKRIFNLALAKFIGFYQVLDIEKVTFLGRRNVRYRIFVFLIVYECLIAVMMLLNGLYYSKNNITESILYTGFVINMFYASYKMYIVLTRSKDIWDCLSITQYDFTLYDHRDRRIILDLWRNRSIWLTSTFMIFSFVMVTFYVTCPLVFNNTFIVMKNRDGSTSTYRMNVLNLYLFIPEEAYNNTYFNVFYIIEASGTYVLVLFVIIFDTIVMTLCLALSCQLHMNFAAFESVGHTSVVDSPNNNNDNIDNKIKLPNEYINGIAMYNNLKTIITDHQNVLKKYDEFLSIFKPIMLLEIFVLSYAIIVLWIIFLTSFIVGEFTESMGVTSMQTGFAIPFCVIQLFMSCFVFDILHNKKDAMTFSLYSCNWTELFDMKCKKLVFLTMGMNDAHHQKLQYTRTRIINLEMFYQTIRVCYSIISVKL
ncbi:hypothetical protein AGLY_012546 [Aphis glycines]|uniref:Odorant receptor n=1 Tax=Aphis glycines TaxID=307491 RepID=A0A6G0T8N5_APHGL|nr:hypothetical protein AGLY_012546 [Aphis glycines]